MMARTTNRPLWLGRTLALIGILLVAANLRTAVAELSPIFAEIRVDMPLTSVDIGVIGALPPICFAVFGIVAPLFAKRMSLEAVLIASLVVIVAGVALRALADSFVLLAVGSAITFAGMAVGNVLLPPIVKRYFPDRIGLLTSLYATVMSISTLFPPLIAVPVADGLGWRTSVGMWAALAVIAIVPWIGVVVRRGSSSDQGADIEEPDPRMLGRVWHTSIAWSLAVVFGVSSLNAYAMFAWLPELLRDTAGADPVQSGALLSLFAGMGIPAGLLIPVLASRMRNVGWLIYAGVVLFVVGYGGLILWPAAATWLWVTCAGLGPLLFPLCLVLINLRTRTHAGAVALSGFVQGIGYVVGAFGPLVVGVLHQISGAWTVPLIFLLITALAGALAGAVVARPVTLEDHLRSRAEAR